MSFNNRSPNTVITQRKRMKGSAGHTKTTVQKQHLLLTWTTSDIYKAMQKVLS